MSEKNKLNNYELNKVVGGDGKDGRDGGAIYNVTSPDSSKPKNSNAIYGTKMQNPMDGASIGGKDPYTAGPQILVENSDQTIQPIKDDYANPWK